MKIDRRCFLSLGVGAAAGTALSPLALKLTDDSSIWSQNWPWTPIPEDGEVSYTNSACTLCPGGCGIAVRKVNQRVVKIEGLPGHPVNDGGICALGLSGPQLLYSPTRVQTPLKRVGQRGEGRWVKISWQQALAEVTDRLGELRGKGQPHTVGAILGSDSGTVPTLFNRFLTVYGSPNFFRMPSIQDTYELTLFLMQGAQAQAGFDLANADFILSFGSGILEGWGSPVRMFRANSAWRESGSRLVHIEPRLSTTAAKADKWIPINPGTEGAFALGLANVIIREGLYRKSFTKEHSFGFEDWTDTQGNPHKGFKTLIGENYTPAKVSQLTGVDPLLVTAVARGFAKASRPLALCGRGQGRQTPGSLLEFMAVHALNALVGNINQEGGIWAVPEADYIEWPQPEMDAVAATGMQQPRIDGAGGEKFPYSRYLLNRLAETMGTGGQSPLQLLFVAGANPAYSLPGSQTVREALEKIPFVVSFSSFMDETANRADLILPEHLYLERLEDIPVAAGLQMPIINLARPVVEPQFDTRHLGDVIIQMARALGGAVAKAFPWDDYETCLVHTLGEKLDPLLENGFWFDPDFAPASWEKAFDTPSGKFEFIAGTTGNGSEKGIDAPPHFEPLALEGPAQDFPLILIPYDSMRLASEYVGSPPFVVKTVGDTVLKGNDLLVEVNPQTARELGLSEGRSAVLTTPRGTAKVKVHLFEGIMPGVLAIPRGLGHSAYDKYLAGKGVNVNELIGPVADPLSGLDAAWGVRAKLARA